jgi:hypothetical protein
MNSIIHPTPNSNYFRKSELIDFIEDQKLEAPVIQQNLESHMKDQIRNAFKKKTDTDLQNIHNIKKPENFAFRALQEVM